MFKQLRLTIILTSFLIVNAKDLFNEVPVIHGCSLDQNYECIKPRYHFFKSFIETTPTSDSSNHCMRFYILDLSQKFMSAEEFNEDVEYFLTESIKNCMNKGIGDLIRIGVFDQIHSVDNINYSGFFECRNYIECNDVIQNFNYENMTIDYGNETDLYASDETFIYTYSNQLSIIFESMFSCPCKFNSVVLLTNRIVNVTTDNSKNYTNIIDASCSEFSVILVGRTDRNYNDTFELLFDSYGIIHDRMNHKSTVFNVPDYNCLGNLTSCILPCNTSSCKDTIFDKCPRIVTTTTATTSTHTTLEASEYPKIVYVLAFSNRYSQKSLTTVLDNLIPPINEINTKPFIYIFKIIITSKNSSQWYVSSNDFKTFLDTITMNETEIVADIIDDSDTETINRLQFAVSSSPSIPGVNLSVIVLLTDFYSARFAETYLLSFDSRNYNFKGYTFNQIVYEHYINLNMTSLLFINAQINETYSLIPPTVTTAGDNTGITSPATTSITPKSTTQKAKINNPDSTPSDNKEKTLIIIFGGIFVSAILIFLLSFFFYRRRQQRKGIEKMIKSHQNPENIDEWELTWDKIMIIKNEELGSGAFGQVLQGKLLGIQKSKNGKLIKEKENVAIKILQRYTNEMSEKKFLNEIQTMKLINGHKNIVKMIGCITVGDRICLVLEFCPFRDLLQYSKTKQTELLAFLQTVEHIKREFLIFAWQISNGMQFLASEGIIHRDLAARNILINEFKIAKISDFGLCVQINDKHKNSPTNNILQIETGKLPVKWLAIESLKNYEFSLHSDVWSFGIVLYEMYSFGKIPFSEIEVSQLLEYLEAGNRLEKPEICSEEIYTVMLKCWNRNPSSRPLFDELITVFTVFLEHSTENYGYLDVIKSGINDKNDLEKNICLS